MTTKERAAYSASALAEDIQSEIDRRGINANTLAKEIGIHNSAIYRALHEEPVSLDVFMRICSALRLDPAAYLPNGGVVVTEELAVDVCFSAETYEEEGEACRTLWEASAWAFSVRMLRLQGFVSEESALRAIRREFMVAQREGV